jgi:hypothetical protein
MKARVYQMVFVQKKSLPPNGLDHHPRGPGSLQAVDPMILHKTHVFPAKFLDMMAIKLQGRRLPETFSGNIPAGAIRLT